MVYRHVIRELSYLNKNWPEKGSLQDILSTCKLKSNLKSLIGSFNRGHYIIHLGGIKQYKS